MSGYGFWNPPEGPDGYPGDALIDAANDAQALRLVLGNLVDALMDESANITDLDLTELPEVVVHLRAACDALGGNYLPYLDHWALTTTASGSTGDPS